MIHTILENVVSNFFNPLLLFFFAGFLIPILRVEFEFPKALFQSLTILLLLGIGWHGGEKLSELKGDSDLIFVLGFMVLGFVVNGLIGLLAYGIIRKTTRLRQIDAATIAGYYGSDSAGSFVTALGFLTTMNVASAPYMPVQIAIMEIPGCLLALIIVAKLRGKGMDAQGNMPGEVDYAPPIVPTDASEIPAMDTSLLGPADQNFEKRRKKKLISGHLLHEVFLNPGTFLLFAGVVIGLLASMQGTKATEEVDHLFNFEFQPMLCLFLMEMGTTACKRIRDLKMAGPGFAVFGLVAPNLFALIGLFAAMGYSAVTGFRIELGTYVLFMVLCGSASLIAVPAVQRMAIPESSPTLPLAASLGLTFTYMVTLGIPLFLEIAKIFVGMPVAVK